MYNVYFQDVQYRITAEELGNIHYGHLGKLMGFEDEVLFYAGVAVKLIGKFANQYVEDAKNSCVYFVNPLLKGSCVVTYGGLNAAMKIYEECSGSYCDAESDAAV